MPFYLFTVQTQDAHGRPLPPLPAGEREKFVMYAPGNSNAAIALMRRHNLGHPQRSYTVYALQGEHPQPFLVCMQPSYGHAAAPGSAPGINPAHVAGGQPEGMPSGRPGQNRPDGHIDQSGFQELGDASLPSGGDSMFGTPSDTQGTFTDLYEGGRIEVPRNR